MDYLYDFLYLKKHLRPKSVAKILVSKLTMVGEYERIDETLLFSMLYAFMSIKVQFVYSSISKARIYTSKNIGSSISPE